MQVLAAWLVVPAGSRWSYVLLAAVGIVAGMVSGIPAWRSDDLFFVVVSSWAIVSGGIELLAGIRARRTGGMLSRDAISVGALGVLLGVVLLLIPAGFLQEYTIDKAGTFVLSGIILGVGMFGGYAAIVAVFLGIAGLTPKQIDAATAASGFERQRRSRGARRRAMSDEKPPAGTFCGPCTCLLIAAGCGVFAMVVTLVSTGAFTSRVNASIANGTYERADPVALGLVVGGGAFIVTLLILAMLILAVDPADVTKTIDRPCCTTRTRGRRPRLRGDRPPRLLLIRAPSRTGRNIGSDRSACP